MALTLLSRNRNFKVIFHVDLICFSAATQNKFIRFLAWKKYLSVVQCIDLDADPMRMQLQLFADLQGTKDFLMDADLWWKSRIPETKHPLTFNVERTNHSVVLMSKSSKLLCINVKPGTNMITGCLTCWETNFSGITTNEALSLFDSLNSQQGRMQFNYGEWRLFGQVVMSIMFSKLECFESLTEISIRTGKTYCESSFYGATGYAYGRNDFR